MSEIFSSVGDMCKICLSSGRKMYALKSFVISLLTFCGVELNTNDYICWECNAMLVKFYTFQQKAKRARVLFEDYSKSQTKPESLSNLTITECYHMDYENYEQKEERMIKTEIELETIDNRATDYQRQEQSDVKIKEEKEDVDSNVELESEDLNLVNDASNEFDDLVSVEPFVKDVNPSNSKPLPLTKDDCKKYLVMQLDHAKMLELRELTLNNILRGKIKFKCDKCLIGFKTEESLVKHMNSAHVPNNTRQELCTICECYIQRKYVNSHVNEHYIAYKCAECTHVSKNRALARKHYYNEHAFKGSLVCRICRRRFEDQETLSKHKELHIPVSCCICKKKLMNKQSLKSHMLLHAEGTPMFQCDICFKYYRGRSGLRIHKAGVHKVRSTKRTYCAKCDIRFDNSIGYEKHVKESSQHTESAKRFVCDKCGSVFTSKNILSQHIQTKHGENHKHICNICRKRFSGPKTLKEHIDYVHKKKPKSKSFECNVCGKGFSTKRLLINHMNSHTGNRPYKCEICDSTYTQSGTLYRHKKEVHKIKKTLK